MFLRGTVFSGKGEGAKFIELPWVKKQMKQKLGFIPYPGTLNVRLAEDDAGELEATVMRAIEISPPTGFCRAICLRLCFMSYPKCFIVIPRVAGYPRQVLELIAPVNLRERFGLRDGDVVVLEVPA